MNIETKVDVKDLDPKHVRGVEKIAEQASNHPTSQRKHYVDKAFNYINNRIDGEQAHHRMKYIRLFYDMVKEYDYAHKHKEEHS